MDEIEIVIFNWDETLCNVDLFPGAANLIKNLQKKGIRVCVLTARPSGNDVRPEIRKTLEENDIHLPEEDVMWVYQNEPYDGNYTHESSGQKKADMIVNLASRNNNLTQDNILFVDDREEYIAAVEKRGFRVRLVPESVVNNVSLRTFFYNEVESYISTINELSDRSKLNENALLVNLYNILHGDIDPFFSTEIQAIRLNQLKNEIQNGEKTLTKTAFSSYIEHQYKKGAIKVNNYISLLQASSCLDDQSQHVASNSDDKSIVTMLLNITKHSAWETQGTKNLFGHKKPDGIAKIAMTNYVDLNSIINDVKT